MSEYVSTDTDALRSTDTGVQSQGAGFGAKTGAYPMAPNNRPYPVGEGAARVRTSVRIPRTQNNDLEFMADLWDLLDDNLGIDRDKKWKVASVIERLITIGIDQFWEQVGGRPRKDESDEDFLRRALDELKKSIARQQ